MSNLLKCPVCHEVFAPRGSEATCSRACATIYHHKSPGKRKMMREYAESKRREPLEDCRAYDPVTRDCNALTGLWCEWEQCKFYRPKGEGQG